MLTINSCSLHTDNQQYTCTCSVHNMIHVHVVSLMIHVHVVSLMIHVHVVSIMIGTAHMSYKESNIIIQYSVRCRLYNWLWTINAYMLRITKFIIDYVLSSIYSSSKIFMYFFVELHVYPEQPGPYTILSNTCNVIWNELPYIMVVPFREVKLFVFFSKTLNH